MEPLGSKRGGGGNCESGGVKDLRDKQRVDELERLVGEGKASRTFEDNQPRWV